jgi:stage IV sporulation protein B
VYVSGESFGIKLYTDGVIIVGIKDVETANGKCNPAKDAGLEKGDIIVSINNVKVTSSTQVEEIFNDNNGNDYEIKVKRNGNYKTFTLTPVYSHSEGKYKVGIWVRDSTAGIGTITFYNPENSVMAALGHPITDVDTNEIMPILNGEAVGANVTKIYKSTDGEAGSLSCDFTNNVIGNLSINSECGIYGKYECDIDTSRLYSVATPQEVEKGSAQLLCTIDDSGPQLYDVEIVHVSYRENNEEKNMVIKVTDANLIEQTGGIVQGMSGSPIIQNGKLVGALTHVIVDSPEKGYAIFAETMLEKSQEVE